jgi:hypothetical protein
LTILAVDAEGIIALIDPERTPASKAGFFFLTAMDTQSNIAKETARRRTFAIISHPDAGKTTLTEKLLLFAGAIQIAGSVKARKATRHATSDWMEIEKQRGISVASSRHAVGVPRHCAEPARHAWSPGLFRRHLPRPHRGGCGA